MTLNAMLSYVGVALMCAAAVFFVIGILRLRRRRVDADGNVDEASRNDESVFMARRADLLCGAMVMATALVALLLSFAHGGPDAGESSGNAGGAAIAISLFTFLCVIACLPVSHRILVRMRRKPSMDGS
jgi:hypothetical protein